MMQQNTAPPPQVSLQQLESHLWGAANILRGSPLDRTDFKAALERCREAEEALRREMTEGGWLS